MRAFLITMLLCLVASSALVARAQGDAGFGTLVVRGRNVKGAEKSIIPLARKRFYVFPGGLSQNQPLIDRIKATEIVSRNCFYSGLQASPCYIAWLKQENCDSPFCRPIKREDIKGIVEFETAYSKGLAAYRNKPDIALSWMINNIPPPLATGFYRQQKNLLATVLSDQKPLQTIMSTSGGAEATFPSLPVAGKTTKYLVSNILPVEISGKSYVWVCEVDVQPVKPTNLVLALPVDPKKKNCIVVEKDLKICNTGVCERK